MNSAGRNQPPHRVAPTQQRFRADDLAGGQIDLRLIVHENSLAIKRPPQALLDGLPFHSPNVHGRL